MTQRLLRTILPALLFACFFGTVPLVLGQETAPEVSKPDTRAIVDQLSDSLVLVETTLSYDLGEAPEAEYMGAAYQSAQNDIAAAWSDLINDERPDERIGFVISPDRVIINDLLVNPRFVKSYRVRIGDQTINAVPAAYAIDQNALLLVLDEPIVDATPLAFNPDAPGPYAACRAMQGNGQWWFTSSPIEGEYYHTKAGRSTYSASWPSLLYGKDGTPIALTFNGTIKADGSWKKSPDDWKWITADQMDQAVALIEKATAQGLPRVEIRLRSPSSADQNSRGQRRGSSSEENITEWNGTGVLLANQQVLVLAKFEPKITARIEEIVVHTQNDESAKATFVGSLRDHTGFIAHLDTPLGEPIALAGKGFLELEDTLLLRSEIRTLGETRTVYTWRCRLPRTTVGFRGVHYPAIGDATIEDFGTGNGDDMNLTFVFTPDGKLAALPMLHRDPVSLGNRQGYIPNRYAGTVATTDLLERVIDEGSEAFDLNNHPLDESEEHRLAWLGVELQAMDPDLARFNGSADLTHGGATGGIVTYIYENSPAQKAGVEVGDILLRLQVEGEPKPIDVRVSPYDMGWGAQFSEALDQLDLEYFDQIPVPWGGAETTLTRALTDIGFGTPFTLDIFRDGTVLHPQLTIEEGPPYYGSSPKYKHEAAGITVRNLTYEVRRFFQLSPDDPGVIVSKIEKGSPAAIAGIKPYELIVAINNQPIHTIEDFSTTLAESNDLQLSIKRMHVGRIVKLHIVQP